MRSDSGVWLLVVVVGKGLTNWTDASCATLSRNVWVVRLEFSGVIVHWRGPSPYYFVEIPNDQSSAIGAVSAEVTYGWGVIPVNAKLGQTKFRTSLFPKDAGYLVPVKKSVREAEQVGLGDDVTIELILDV